jgi:flagellar biosynthesis protein FlhG
MANVDIFFGVKPQGTVRDVIYGDKEMKDILLEVSKDVFLIPGGSGLVDFNFMNNFERRAVLDSVSALPHDFDYLLIDTAPGIADNVLFLNSAAQEVSVVLTPDPASFADAYALIKVLNQVHKLNHFRSSAIRCATKPKAWVFTSASMKWRAAFSWSVWITGARCPWTRPSEKQPKINVSL